MTKRSKSKRFFWITAALSCLACLAIAAIAAVPNPQSTVRSEQASAVSERISQAPISSGLTLAATGTPDVYFVRNGEPLLSFGGMSDFIFYAAPDAFDYKQWADWAAQNGMNHVRAYPPLSWKHVEKFAKENGGAPENLLFPYRETRPGSRQFDLTQFDDDYWNHFRAQCEYLQSKGIIIHLLMVNGWQLEDVNRNWGGHFFNPENNVNDFTNGLKDNRLAFYHSVADGNDGLVEAQQAWLRKLVEETADLDNVYYDLVHEIAENHQDWNKVKAWIEPMAQTVRSHFTSLQPNRAPILAMDTGGLQANQRRWIFSRPYFDLLIYGKAHKVEQARAWRNQYKKPYVPQESWDDDGTKYSLRNPEDRVHLRKYIWKFVMAKCQQMDIYARPLSRNDLGDRFPHSYDPTENTPFESDAVVLRQVWNQLDDYANLKFQGQVQSRMSPHQYVLSSPNEALVYLSSETGKQNVSFRSQSLTLRDLALTTGEYTAQIIEPSTGTKSDFSISVDKGRTTIAAPSFVDDLAIHILPPRS